MRRLQSALLAATLIVSGPLVVAQSGNDLFQKALSKERAEGRLDEAIQIYERIVREFTSDRSLAAKALVQMGRCYETLGRTEARAAYERVIREFGDQLDAAAQARGRLSALTQFVGFSGAVARQVWVGKEVNYGNAISPDGRYLTFIESDYSLGLLELGTGKKRVLDQSSMASGEFVQWSTFSPDGKYIAYEWIGPRGTTPLNPGWIMQLKIVGVNGSAPRVLYQNAEVDYMNLTWSPDLKQIAAVIGRKDRSNQIALVSVSSGSVRALKTMDWRKPGRLNFSPDGRSIAYDFPPDDHSDARDIFLIAADGSRETRLVSDPADDVLLGWEPDGDRILFVSDRTGSPGAFAIEASAGAPRGAPQLVKSNIGRVEPIGFTKNGPYYYRVRSSMSDVFIAALEASTGAPIGPSTIVTRSRVQANSAADWSPDGKYLAYVSKRVAASAQPIPIIVVRSMDNGSERELAPELTLMNALRWSPGSGSMLVTGRDKKGRFGLYVLDAQTAAIEEFIADGNQGAWLRDGSGFIFGKNDSANARRPLKRFDLAEREEETLYQGVAGLARAVSPDGRYVAFSCFEKGSVLRVMPVNGGDAREVFRPTGRFSLGSIAWSADGNDLFFVLRKDPEIRNELWRIRAAGGEPRRLGLTLDPMSQLSVHPDGRTIAFDVREIHSEAWVMENLLPPLAKTTSARRPGTRGEGR